MLQSWRRELHVDHQASVCVSVVGSGVVGVHQLFNHVSMLSIHPAPCSVRCSFVHHHITVSGLDAQLFQKRCSSDRQPQHSAEHFC